MKTTNERKYEEALWACDECRVWWASQSYVKETNLLLDLPAALSRHLPWDEFRGWRLQETAVCPCCHQKQEEPIYGEVETDDILASKLMSAPVPELV